MSDQVALNMTCDCLSRLPRLDFLVFHRVLSVNIHSGYLRFITLLISISVADVRPFYWEINFDFIIKDLLGLV